MYTKQQAYCKQYMRLLHGNILTQINGLVFLGDQRVTLVLAQAYQGNFGLASLSRPLSSGIGGAIFPMVDRLGCREAMVGPLSFPVRSLRCIEWSFFPRSVPETLDLQLLLPSGLPGGPNVCTGPPG